MRPEQALYNLIKDHLPGHHQRIESIAGVGAPDIELCYEGKSCWIELKVPANKYVSEWTMLRPSQQVWHLRRVKALGNVFLLFRISDTICLTKGMLTISGEKVMYQYLWSQTKPWNWEVFRTELIGALK
jgi:hypothetical protein